MVGKAERTLSRIGGRDYAAAALAEIRASLVHEDKHVRLRELLEHRVLVVLGLGIFLAVFQLGLALHIRNTLIACASEGARYGARADATPADGERRARELIRS